MCMGGIDDVRCVCVCVCVWGGGASSQFYTALVHVLAVSARSCRHWPLRRTLRQRATRKRFARCRAGCRGRRLRATARLPRLLHCAWWAAGARDPGAAACARFLACARARVSACVRACAVHHAPVRRRYERQRAGMQDEIDHLRADVARLCADLASQVRCGAARCVRVNSSSSCYMAARLGDPRAVRSPLVAQEAGTPRAAGDTSMVGAVIAEGARRRAEEAAVAFAAGAPRAAPRVPGGW